MQVEVPTRQAETWSICRDFVGPEPSGCHSLRKSQRLAPRSWLRGMAACRRPSRARSTASKAVADRASQAFDPSPALLVDSNASSVDTHADESTTNVAARTDIDGVAARHRAVEVTAAAELARPHGHRRAPWSVPDLWRTWLVGQPFAQGDRRDRPRRTGLRVHGVPTWPVERRATPGRAGHHASHAAGENRRAADGQSGFARRPTWDDVRSAQARRDAVPQWRDGRVTILRPARGRRWRHTDNAGQSVSWHDQGR